MTKQQTPHDPDISLVSALWHFIENGDGTTGEFFELRERVRQHGALYDSAPDLLIVAKRHRHLLQELHAGNQFSKERLWQALTETETAISRAHP